LTQSRIDSRLQTSLSFTLAVRRGTEAVEFYKRAFGATEVQRAESSDGNVVVQLEIGGARFFVADESVAHANFSPESLGNRSSVRLALIVDEPEAVARRAVAAGAQEIYPVEDQPCGWRLGRVADPFAHHWEIGRPLHDHS
jgi:PhnB protein